MNKQANTQYEDFCNKESNGSKTKLLKTGKIGKDQKGGSAHWRHTDIIKALPLVTSVTPVKSDNPKMLASSSEPPNNEKLKPCLKKSRMEVQSGKGTLVRGTEAWGAPSPGTGRNPPSASPFRHSSVPSSKLPAPHETMETANTK